MKGLSEILGPPLETLPGIAADRFPDFMGLWERWASEGPAVFFESAGPLGNANQWLVLAGLPQTEFFERDGKAWWREGHKTQPSPVDFWHFADQIGTAKAEFKNLPYCLDQAWFGVLSYDFGKRFHVKPGAERDGSMQLVPGFYFFKPSRVVAFNRQTRETFFFGSEFWEGRQEASSGLAQFKIKDLQACATLSQYEAKVRRVQEYISQGDIYQANIAQTFRARWEGSPSALYRTLREMNPGPFMGLFQGGDFTVVSSSPERLAAGRGDWLETRPIAGTRPRGKDDPEDLRLRQELKTNAKEQAEHLMLVDLARNDLGRVSRYGTVEVERYAEVESYARVQHLVSTVRSLRRADAPISEILKSLFPGGTITGCPKIRCMEIIDEIEEGARGFYTGSMGYLAPGPCFDFNILIRSFTLFSNGLMEFQAGAGVVADSDPKREYQETLYKVEALAQALGTSLVAHP